MNQTNQRHDGLDLLSTGVILLNLDGRFLFANTAAESLFGHSRSVLLERNCQPFIEGASDWLAAYRQTRSPTFVIRFRLTRVLRSPHDTVQVYLTVHPNVDDPEVLIAEMTPAKASLRQTRNRHMNELSESTRRLLRNLAHEVKNPLGGIRGAAQLLLADLQEEEHQEFAKVVISEADRLQHLVDRLLAPYRHPFQPQSINIHEVLERVRLLIESEFPVGLTIVRDFDISAPEIRGDRGQLVQVFLNLMRNAAEALTAKMALGEAEIRLVTRVVLNATCGLETLRTALNVHVIDNGEGIPESIADSVFYPLVSGKANGSGLGLSLVQSFVEQHAGSIEVTSEPGRTDFSLIFPLASQ